MNQKIPYFIYTSGERGVHGLDWGAKFVSPSWGTADDADLLYRTLMDRYGLRPSLERPNDGDSAFLILPFSKRSFRGYLFGMFQPYRDSDAQGNRPNISLIACLISDTVARKSSLTPTRIAAVLLQREGLKTIGFREQDRHPDFSQRPSEIELDPSSVFQMPHALSNLDAWPKGAEGLWVFDGKLRRLFPVQSEKVTEDQTTSGGRVRRPNLGKLRTKWLIGLGFFAFIVVLFFISRDGKEQLPGKPPEKDAIAEFKSIEMNPVKKKYNSEMKKKKPEPVTAKSLLEIFAPADRKSFEYVALLDSTQTKTFIHGGRVANVKLFPLDEKATATEKRTFQSIGPSDEGFLVTPKVISHLLQHMVEKWEMPYSGAKSSYYPLEIESEILFEDAERLRAVSENMQRCGALKAGELKSKGSNPDSRLRNVLNKFLLDQNTNITKPEYGSRIIFIASTTETGMFRGCYSENRVAGKKMPRSNILVTEGLQVKMPDARELSDGIRRFFSPSDPDRPDLLKISNKRMDKELIVKMTKLKAEKKNDADSPQVPEILKYLSEQIFKKL